VCAKVSPEGEEKNSVGLFAPLPILHSREYPSVPMSLENSLCVTCMMGTKIVLVFLHDSLAQPFVVSAISDSNRKSWKSGCNHSG